MLEAELPVKKRRQSRKRVNKEGGDALAEARVENQVNKEGGDALELVEVKVENHVNKEGGDALDLVEVKVEKRGNKERGDAVVELKVETTVISNNEPGGSSLGSNYINCVLNCESSLPPPSIDDPRGKKKVEMFLLPVVL